MIEILTLPYNGRTKIIRISVFRRVGCLLDLLTPTLIVTFVRKLSHIDNVINTRYRHGPLYFLGDCQIILTLKLIYIYIHGFVCLFQGYIVLTPLLIM